MASTAADDGFGDGDRIRTADLASKHASKAQNRRPTPQIARLANSVGTNTQQLKAAARLIDEGNSVPFVARYRKEATGGLDEGQLRAIVAGLAAIDQLEESRASVLGKLEKLGVLSEALRSQVLQAQTVQDLEDLYLPHRPKRTTKASSARDKGLAPLAEAILRGGRSGAGGSADTLERLARKFVKPPDVASPADALAGAQDIISEMAAELPQAREEARLALWQQGGLLVSQLSRAAKQARQAQQGASEPKAGLKGSKSGAAQQQGGKKQGAGSGQVAMYATYHDFRCPVSSVRPHQVLALNRGEAQGVLSLSFQWRLEGVEAVCQRLLLEQAGAGRLPVASAYLQLIQAAVQSGVKRLLRPAIEREARGKLTGVGGEHAAQAFARNLRHLLMQPPLPAMTVLGVDPAFRTGCKLAVCDPTGRVLESGVVYPHVPASEAQRKQAAPQLASLIRKHGVQAVAIGNGTASRETQRFVAGALAGTGLSAQAGWCVVSEAGASVYRWAGVYSACELAAEELPQLDVSLRGAVSIARRLQDPLAELVKVPSETLGVGQYQQDLKAAALADQLAGVVESVVNAVGVDLNTASPALLSHVSGLSKPTAAAIVAQRDSQGRPFKSRQELLSVKGVGPRTFQQSAGFLRVRGGEAALDGTAVHPESYAAAEALVWEACGGAPPEGAASGPPPRKKRRKGASSSEAPAGLGAGAPAPRGITVAMLQQAKPALQALLGRAGPRPGLGKGAALGKDPEERQQGGAGAAASRGAWVSGETAAQVAARLGVGEFTLRDILEALLAPERDVRGQAGLESLQFKQALGIGDLAPGMELSGVVRNVTDFGAFVDINVGQDGLVHVSELRKGGAALPEQHSSSTAAGRQREQRRQREDQGDAYSRAAVGDLLHVRVVAVDAARGRISLALV